MIYLQTDTFDKQMSTTHCQFLQGEQQATKYPILANNSRSCSSSVPISINELLGST